MRRLIFPVNFENLHWAIGVVDLVAREVTLYDSLGNPTNLADFHEVPTMKPSISNTG